MLKTASSRKCIFLTVIFLELFVIPFSFSWADGGVSSLKLVNNTHEKNIPEIHWDTAPFLIQETKNEAGISISYVMLSGKYSTNSENSLALILENYDPISIVLGPTDEHRFSVRVPISAITTQFRLLSVSLQGVPDEDTYLLEIPSYGSMVEIGSVSGSRLSLKRVNLSAGFFYLDSSAYSFTPMLGWRPVYLWARFLVHLSLGVTPLLRGGSFFLGVEYGLGASYPIYKSLWAGVSGGMQFFTDYGTHAPFFGGLLTYQLGRKVLFLVDQMTVEYDGFFGPGYFASEAKLGVGIAF